MWKPVFLGPKNITDIIGIIQCKHIQELKRKPNSNTKYTKLKFKENKILSQEFSR